MSPVHMQHRDVTHDITAPPDDVTSKHKKTRFGHGTSEVHQHKMALKQLQCLGQEPPGSPAGPRDATYGTSSHLVLNI